MTKEELLKSRERKILLPEYDPGEKNRFFNGIDLNNNKNTDFGSRYLILRNWHIRCNLYFKTVATIII